MSKFDVKYSYDSTMTREDGTQHNFSVVVNVKSDSPESLEGEATLTDSTGLNNTVKLPGELILLLSEAFGSTMLYTRLASLKPNVPAPVAISTGN